MKHENIDLEKILRDKKLTREQKNHAINTYYDSYRKNVDDELNKYIQLQNIGAALEIGSAVIPVGGEAKFAKEGYNLLKPLVKQYGQKITERVGQGIVGGTVAGIAHGIGSAILNADTNPVGEFVKSVAGGTVTGGLGNAALGKAEQYIAGNALKKAVSRDDLTRDEMKVLREQAREYYNNYLKNTTVSRSDIGDIYFRNAGIGEQVAKGLHNVGLLPDLKKQIKTGIYKGTQKDYPRNDIDRFHIIENKLKNKKYEYQIAEDSNEKKYYLVKDAKKTEVTPTDRNQNPASVSTSTISINDGVQNLNPRQVAIFSAFNNSPKPQSGQDIEQTFDGEPIKGYVQKNVYPFDSIPMAEPIIQVKSSPQNHIFTPSEIENMTDKEFTQNEQNIMQQVQDGLIKPENLQINYSGYSNQVNGSGQIFSRENIDAMSNEEYTKNEKAINAQLNSIGIPSNAELQSATQNGNGVIYVKPYTRSDGTKVQGYYRSL